MRHMSANNGCARATRALLVVLSGCCGAKGNRDADQVYRALLAQVAPTLEGAERPLRTLVVIADAGERGDRWLPLKARLPAAMRDTYDDFCARSGTPSLHEISEAGGCSILVASQLQLPGDTGIAIREFEALFRKSYPNAALVTLSGVGFSTARTQALVYLSEPSHYGAFYLLELVGQKWVLAGEYVVWVA